MRNYSQDTLSQRTRNNPRKLRQENHNKQKTEGRTYIPYHPDGETGGTNFTEKMKMMAVFKETSGIR